MPRHSGDCSCFLCTDTSALFKRKSGKMGITRKIDRAFQWAGEKMGAEARTTMSEDFLMLETEMALRQDGMERLQKSMNGYVKWLGRRGELFEDKEKGLAISYMARTMLAHGDDFEPDSEYGNCLIAMGRANEEIANVQEDYLANATTTWLEGLDRSMAMMKEYQSSRKKLESRRLAYDASTSKLQKAKRDDFRLEEELRTSKAKYEESSEDVFRRMQDIKEAESDSVRDLTSFLDAELEYHERCAEELRRVKRQWPAGNAGASPKRQSSLGGASLERRATGRSRSNTVGSLHSLGERLSRTNSRGNVEFFDEEEEPEPARLTTIRSNTSARLNRSGTSTPAHRDVPELPMRPAMARASTYQVTDRERDAPRVPSGRYSGATTPSSPSVAARESYFGNQASTYQNVGSLRGNLRPASRAVTGASRASNYDRGQEDVFADRGEDTASSSGDGADWGERSASPATSFGSMNHSTGNLTGGVPTPLTGAAGGFRKAPPPPPPSRAKKPAPPLPVKREISISMS